MSNVKSLLRVLGLNIKGESNGEINVFCPNCERNKTEGEAHLYVNTLRGLWDCKHGCGRGNDFDLVVLAKFGKTQALTKDQRRVVMETLKDHGLRQRLPQGRGGARPTLTIADLAQQKKVTEASLRRLGVQEMGNGVAFPMRNASGDLTGLRVRLPGGGQRTFGPTKGRKAKLALLIPEGLNKSEPIILCEGETDCAKALDIGLNAMATPGAGRISNRDACFFQDCVVYIVPDLDEVGEKGAETIARKIYRIAKEIRIVRLPGEIKPDHGQDFRDFFNGGGTAEDFTRLASEAKTFGLDADLPATRLQYREESGGIIWLKPTQNGETPVRLTNFTARIVSDLVRDDGAETRRLFEILGEVKRRAKLFQLPANDFQAMNWPTEHLGATALVSPGFGTKDHARYAIQALSGNVPERQVYVHTGWRKIDDLWVYLHAGGAIGKDGPVGTVETNLQGSVGKYSLPPPPAGKDREQAVRASLRFLELAPAHVTFPLFAAIWRGAIGPADFSVHLSGVTQCQKTELAALVQQHFGPEMIAKNLPGNWFSTANALGDLAFEVKDAIFVIDDFAPQKSKLRVDDLHAKADRIIRAAGNHSARQRMRGNLSRAPEKPPRCLILSTGEDVPRGQSLRARMVVLDLGRGDVNLARLTECQRDAERGLYAQALAAFVQWLAGDFESGTARLSHDVVNFRDRDSISGNNAGRRTTDNLAHLAIGMRRFLAFAKDVQAVNPQESEDLWKRCFEALNTVNSAQQAHQASEDPVTRFLDLLDAAIASGHAHLANAEGTVPDGNPATFGWRQNEFQNGWSSSREWRPQGDRIGWIDFEGGNLYLESQAAYAVANRMGNSENLGLTLRTLIKRLKEGGLLKSTEATRETLTVRKILEGKRRNVVHLSVNAFGHIYPGKPDQPDQPDRRTENDNSQPDQPDHNPTSASHSGTDTSKELGGLGRFSDPREAKCENLGNAGQVDFENLTNDPIKPDQKAWQEV